jgi:hypothetical protein
MIHRSKYLKDIQKQKPGISGKVFCSSLLPAVPILLCFLLLFSMAARAEVAPVAIRIPEAKAWIGQRLPFYVELRAPGSFAGAASFSLPEIPRTVILKIGNPIVSSQQIDGESWFVQTHEFALFSQQSGTLQIPEFEVRFASRDGFTGPVKEQQAQVPAARIEIQRPPGSESTGFLVTTESLDLTENWEPQPQPGRVKVGAIFKRTIVQRAAQITGMALAAAPTDAPDGVRVYPGQPEVTDKTERGDFLGERRETITYQLQKPGSFELPELSYVWWNPRTEQLQSKTLPAVTFEVAASGETTALHRNWLWLLVALLVTGLGLWQRRRLVILLTQYWKKLNPPEGVAARKLLQACRRRDAVAAQTSWNQWHSMQDASFLPGPDLRAAVIEMQRCLFGPATAGSWRGDELARAFDAEHALAKTSDTARTTSDLPLLNP